MGRKGRDKRGSETFTAHERALSARDFGTQRARLGGDSLASAGACAICLTRVAPSDTPLGNLPQACGFLVPGSSSSGTTGQIKANVNSEGSESGELCGVVMCRECALESILAARQGISARRARLKDAEQREQQQQQQKEADANSRKRKVDEVGRSAAAAADPAALERQRQGSAGGGEGATESSASGASRKRARVDDLTASATDQRSTALGQMDSLHAAQREQFATGLNHWVPGAQQAVSAQQQRLAEDKSALRDHDVPLCPCGDHELSTKNLVTLRFTPSAEGVSVGPVSGGQEQHSFECPLCKKSLSNAVHATAIVRCGHVLCRSCVDVTVGEGRHAKCPVCDRRVHKKAKKKSAHPPRLAVVNLVGGGTSFAGSGGQKIAAKATAAIRV
jgi:Rtf2 RING-finger